MRVTLNVIAKEVGVDKSTVSATLRNMPRAQRFRPEIREKIIETARRLNYRPNFFAAQLRSSQKRVLLLCLSYLQDAYSAEIAESFEKRAEEKGYRIIFSVFQDKEDPFVHNREILGTHGISGMAVIGSSPKKLTDKAIRSLADEGVSIVLVGRNLDHPQVSRVLVDDFAGGQIAVKYLADQGISKLWILSGPREGPRFDLRTRGILDFFESTGSVKPKILFSPALPNVNRSVSAYQLMKDELGKEGIEQPEGIVALSDALAYGALRGLTESGLIPGRDVAVIGYDDIWPSQFTTPPLTTLRQPMRRMGVTAADILIDSLEGECPRGEKVVFTPELVVRGSGSIPGRS